MKKIPIFFSSDNNYVPFMAVTISSLIKNASKDYIYDIIVLYTNINEEDLKILKSMETDNVNIIAMSMDERQKELTKGSTTNLCTDYYSLSIYFRIFIPLMFPEYDRGIYLDSDMVVTGNISELFNFDLQGNPIGAVVDQSVQTVPVFIDYINTGLGVDVKKYINSGVLVMDMKQLRELNFCNKFLSVLNKYRFETVAPDQDYINVLCYNKIQSIPDQWNAMSSELIYGIKDPKIFHFNLFGKPWRYNNIPFEEVFWNAAKESPYYDYIMNVKKTYPDKKRKIAEKYLKEMLEKAAKITTADNNFASVFSTGKESRI